MKIKLEGVKELQQALRRYVKDTGKAFNRGAQLAGHAIMEVSQGVVPVDTGALKASGIVFTEGTGWKTECIIGYGSDVTGFERIPAQYAAIVEEGPRPRFYLRNSVYTSLDVVYNLIYQEVASV